MARVKLGDVAKESKGAVKNARELPTVGLEHLTPGVLELERWDETSETTFTKAFKKDQILFGRRRAYLKKAAVAPFDGVCSGDITVIEAIPGKIDKRLLPFVIHNDALFDFAMSRSAGGLSPRVKWNDLKEFEFNLPPIEEQARIADLLWAMNDTKKAYRNLLAATDELVKARFVEMFGDPENNNKLWPIQTLEKLCYVGSSKRIYQHELKPSGISFLRISDLIIKMNKGIPDSRLYISKAKYEELLKLGLVPIPGDILITSRGTLGLCYIVKNEDKFYFQDGMISWLSKIDNRIDPIYLKYLFTMPGFRTQLNILQAGSTVTFLSISMLKKLKIMVPSKTAQKSFSSFVNQIEEVKISICASITRTERIINSLLNNHLS